MGRDRMECDRIRRNIKGKIGKEEDEKEREKGRKERKGKEK